MVLRQIEIEKFIIEEYWTISGIFQNSSGEKFSSRLIEFDQKKLKKFDIPNKEHSKKILNEISSESGKIRNLTSGLAIIKKKNDFYIGKTKGIFNTNPEL